MIPRLPEGTMPSLHPIPANRKSPWLIRNCPSSSSPKESNHRKSLSLALICLLAVCYSVAAWGQGSAESSVRGNLSGTVVDISGAIITQAKVTLSGSTGTKAILTDQDGAFTFSLLTPGFYSLKIEKTSFRSAEIRNVEVVTGKNTVVRIALPVGSITETVTVEGSAIAVDTTSTAIGSNLTDRFYNAVPFERGVANIFFASPGVGSGLGAGPQNPSISGGSGLENLYVADGVSITDGAFGGLGVYSRDYGSLGSGINLSFVKEVQVKTGGFEAQYGKSTGGIIQIVTKSGGNSFHGEIGGYLAPASFERERLQRDDFLLGNNAFGVQGQIFNLSGKLLRQSEFEVDAEFSGYVPGLRDRLFFFASYDPTWATAHEQFPQFHNLDCTTCAPNLGNLDVETR